jgi:N-acetylglucosamine-6-phosphate deacetylase
MAPDSRSTRLIVLTAYRLYTPQKEIIDPLVFVEDGIVTGVASRDEREVPNHATILDFASEHPGAILAPGFLDIHIHGGMGVDVMQASPRELPAFQRFLAAHGVTAYFPTTVAAPLEATCAALERMANAIDGLEKSSTGNEPVQARPLGIHLEGPFLSHKRRGVHPPENLQEPSIQIFDRLWQAARGHIRMMTIAPELPGALPLIAEAARRNVLVSLGHSDADSATSRSAVGSGARHATHTFNAMRPLDHREPGIAGEALTNPNLTADVIADGIHVAPEIVKLFLLAKGYERAILITDATAATGMPDGAYQLGPIRVEVRDGRCTLACEPGKLAGSVLTMDRAVRNATQFSQWRLQDAVRAATLNPARAAGLAHHGEIATGAEANLVLLNSRGEILKTVVGGRGT